MFPFLSLEHVDLDFEIAQRLSRRLAYYHLALPIAQDADGITVAMAHPENDKVIGVLEAALRAKVIPVQSFAETIRQQLDRVWQVQNPATALRVTVWTTSAAFVNSSAAELQGLLSSLGREAVLDRVASEDFAAAAGTDLVIAFSDDEALSPVMPEALFHSPASLLLLRRRWTSPKAILHVLRGHIPDYRVLDWLVPLAQHNSAEITLFMGVDGTADAGARKPFVSDLSSILMARDKRQAHVAECRRLLRDTDVSGRLKIRQDGLLTAIRAELAERPYDLVAIAAEAYGDFAQQVGALVWPKTSAFLVIKP